MSDSYSKWCEEQEENNRIFSDEAVRDVKSSKAFASALKRASDCCRNTKLHGAKSCENCARRKYLNGEDICAKLGTRIYSENYICEHWKSAIGSGWRRFVPEEDVIAWLVIDRAKKRPK